MEQDINLASGNVWVLRTTILHTFLDCTQISMTSWEPAREYLTSEENRRQTMFSRSESGIDSVEGLGPYIGLDLLGWPTDDELFEFSKLNDIQPPFDSNTMITSGPAQSSLSTIYEAVPFPSSSEPCGEIHRPYLAPLATLGPSTSPYAGMDDMSLLTWGVYPLPSVTGNN